MKSREFYKVFIPLKLDKKEKKFNLFRRGGIEDIKTALKSHHIYGRQELAGLKWMRSKPLLRRTRGKKKKKA